MHRVLQEVQEATWAQRLFLVVTGMNFVLILGGIHLVPSTLTTLNGVGALLAALSMQLALAALALVGPWSFHRCHATIAISFGLSVIFAALYLTVVDLGGGSDPINIYGIFVGVAFVAGLVAGATTRHLLQGVIAGIWALVIGTGLWSTGMLLINHAT